MRIRSVTSYVVIKTNEVDFYFLTWRDCWHIAWGREVSCTTGGLYNLTFYVRKQSSAHMHRSELHTHVV